MIRDTSIDTYYEIKDNGLLSEMRLQAYGLLVDHGAMTANELMAKAKEYYPNISHQRVESLGRRLSELRDLGCVDEVGIVVCSITKRKCIKWAVNGKLPIIQIDKKRLTNPQKLDIMKCKIELFLQTRQDDLLFEALQILEK